MGNVFPFLEIFKSKLKESWDGEVDVVYNKEWEYIVFHMLKDDQTYSFKIGLGEWLDNVITYLDQYVNLIIKRAEEKYDVETSDG